MKAVLDDGRRLVVRAKKEEDAPLERIEDQSRFAAALAAHGIETPRVYASDGRYARWYGIGGYDVIVTVEDFADGQLQTVDLETARKTGRLLARMHTIAEAGDLHVRGGVLFDPLRENDLFRFETIVEHRDALAAVDAELYESIVEEHERLLREVRVFEQAPRYAVQGDISDCNLYATARGEIGVFDYNWSGDNVLFFDAVMQAVFEARLMDYPAELAGEQERPVLSAFLQGYDAERPFTEEQERVFPYLYALISAFWLGDQEWCRQSPGQTGGDLDREALRRGMEATLARTRYLPAMPV